MMLEVVKNKPENKVKAKSFKSVEQVHGEVS